MENIFLVMSDKELEECYHQHINYEVNKEINEERLMNIYEQYLTEFGDRAAMPVMTSQLLHEISKRWCKVYKTAW